ncbi:MAG: acyl-CoA dehydrogenase family protein [Frankia sp.]|nr:acyl-CoA dehydrogenase family protein [Frankia sp.]
MRDVTQDPARDEGQDGRTQPPPLAEYRARARAWIAENLERASGSRVEYRVGEPADLAAERRLQRRLYAAGYAGISWPREYGGQGLPAEYERAFRLEARGYRLPDFGVVGGTTYGVCALTMLAHASPEFRRRHIPRILAGDELWVEFFSEPAAGSDLAGVRTTATRDPSGTWILNGSKIWSSGAYYADWGMCLARTNWDVPKHRGLTWFAVPATAPGVTIRRIRQITGDAEFCEEFFDNVELSDDDVIGEVDNGWTVTQTMLLFERGGGAAHDSSRRVAPRGIAPDLVELARSVGRLNDPLARDLIVRAHVDDLARRALLARLGQRMTRDPGTAASLASYGKLSSGVYDPIRARLAMEIGGPDAVAWERDDADPAATAQAKAAEAFLGSRFMSIAGGTNEMQRNTIGERVLGLPREPSFDRDKPFREVLQDARAWTGRGGSSR